MTAQTRPLAGTRVLFVGSVDWAVLLHWRDLLSRLVAEGASVTVMCAASGDTPVIEALGVQVIEVPFTRSGRSPIVELRALGRIAKGLRMVRPDLIHTVTIKPNLYATLCARILSRQSVVLNAVTGFGYVFESRDARVLRTAISWAYRVLFRSRSVHIQVENPEAVDRVVELGFTPRERTHLITGAGVDCVEFAPPDQRAPSEVPTVLMPARILYDKGVVEYVKAARMVREMGVNAHFLIAGKLDEDGNPAAIPRSAFLDLLDGSGVEWLGNRPDIPEIMRQSDIVALPSYHEGLPKALLEGAASGCALVASDIAGCRPVVADEVNGRLVPPRDVEHLAMAFQDLCLDRVRCGQMGVASRAIALREFEIGHILNQFVDLYCRTLGRALPTAVTDETVVVGAGWLGRSLGAHLGCEVLPQRELTKSQLGGAKCVVVASGRNRVSRGESFSHLLKTELAQLEELLRWCREIGARAIVLGSADVCGSTDRISGSSPPSPTSRYGELKLRREELATRFACAGGDVVTLRLAAVHGMGKAQSRRLVRLSRSPLLVLPGSGSRSMGVVTLRSVVEAVRALTEADRAPSVVSVGAGYVRADELFAELAALQQRATTVLWVPIPMAVARLGMRAPIPILRWLSRFSSSREVNMEAGVESESTREIAAYLVGYART